MKPEAIKALKTLLTQFKTKEDFYSKIREKTGLKADEYLTFVQAIWAVRSIINRYDKSLYGEVANKWDEKVVLERYSESINKHIDAHGYAKVIKVIRELQKEGRWSVPEPLKKTSANRLMQEEPTEPKKMGLKVVGHLENGKFVPASPDKAIKVLTTTESKIVEPKVEAPASVVLDDESYEILNFSKRTSNSSLDDYHLRVSRRSGNNYVAFNVYLSDLCEDKGVCHVYFRVDKLANRLYMVITDKPTTNSIPARRKNKGSGIFYVCNKKLVDFLHARFNLQKDVDEVKVTKNLSKLDNVVTVEVG